MSVLGVAMVSLLGLHARNVRLTSQAQDLTIAGMLASRVAAESQASRTPVPAGITSGEFSDREASLSFAGEEIYGDTLAARFRWRREVEYIDLARLGLPLRVPRIRVSVGTEDNPEIAVLVVLQPGASAP